MIGEKKDIPRISESVLYEKFLHHCNTNLFGRYFIRKAEVQSWEAGEAKGVKRKGKEEEVCGGGGGGVSIRMYVIGAGGVASQKTLPCK